MAPPFDTPTASNPPTGQAWLDSFEETLANLTPADHAAMDRVDAARAEYGLDFERELADLDAGRHPLQRPRG